MTQAIVADGAGKSTLLRLIAGELASTGGKGAGRGPGRPPAPGPDARPGLAAQFLQRPDVLLLDEPTNKLDLASARQLTQALAAYRGALLVASHDLPFLRTIGITRWLRLGGRLTQIDPR